MKLGIWKAEGSKVIVDNGHGKTIAVISVKKRSGFIDKEAEMAQVASKALEMREMLEKLITANPIHEGYHELKLKAIQLIKEATTINNAK